MSLWRHVARGLRTLTNRSAADHDLADEVRDYFDRAVEAHQARGLTPDQAHRAARMEVGHETAVREQVREYGWEHVLETFAADIRYAARGLRAAPGFTAVVILTLAVGLGATTAIFSAVKPILLQPLAYPDPDRVVTIQEVRRNGSIAEGTFGMYRWFVERSRAFDAIAVLAPWQPTVTGTDEPERLVGQRVSASYFRVLGVQPTIGPGFRVADDILNGPNTVILSHALWRRRFAADQTMVGRQVTLDDTGYTVVGVMPESFHNVLAPASELWSLLQYDMSQGRAWGHHLRTVGRLGPGVGVGGASLEIDDLGQRGARSLPGATYGSVVKFRVMSLGDEVTRGVQPMLLSITVAVIFVLVIACANVTNLLLARGVRRRDEFAVRAALGAGGSRLLRQQLTESLFLGIIGGVAGMVVAMLGVRGLVALSPPGLPRIDAIRVDTQVFLFALGVTTLVGVLIGVVPALQAARSVRQDALHGARFTSSGHRRMRRGLVVAEVALALMLLVGSGLLFRSLQRLFAVPVGFDAAGALTVQVQTAGQRLRDKAVAMQFFERVAASVRHVPGVIEVAWTSQLPLSGDRDEFGVRFESTTDEDAAPGAKAKGTSTFRYAVSPGYIDTMGIPVRQGRAFDERDHEGAPLVALVSESLATLKFGSPGAAIGQRLQIGSTDGPLYTVAGVVGDVKQMSLALSQSEAVYTTARQWVGQDRVITLVVRSAGDPLALTPAVRRAIAVVDPNQPISRVATLEGLVRATGGERRFALILFAAFALAALVLSAAGCYGVVASYVAERTREISVRSVLGASRGTIVVHVVRQGLALVGSGVVLGLVGALVASRALNSLLFGLTRLDPIAYLAAAALLLVVALISSGIPAWKAVRIDPASTLKAQ